MITQSDKQDLLNSLQKHSNQILQEVHKHLKEQDRRLEKQDALIDKLMKEMSLHEGDKEVTGADSQ